MNVVGSLVVDRGPGSLFIVDDFIEFTQGRQSTFFDQPGEVTHTDMTSVYDPELSETLKQAAELEGQHVTDSATYVCVDGPRFETPAEIRMFAQMGAHVVGMTGYPEVALAREAGLRYCSIAVVSNLAAGMTEDVVEEKRIWAALEATKDPVFRILKRCVQLRSSRRMINDSSDHRRWSDLSRPRSVQMANGCQATRSRNGSSLDEQRSTESGRDRPTIDATETTSFTASRTPYKFAKN